MQRLSKYEILCLELDLDDLYLFVGGGEFSRQVSQTCQTIQDAVSFGKQHRSLRGGGMEKVQGDHRSSFLGGT